MYNFEAVANITNRVSHIFVRGIDRKSASVIIREAVVNAEGVMVDLHVVRVAQRLGIANHVDPKKIEQQIMEVIPSSD